MKIKVIDPITATENLDAVDVMEAVAHNLDGSEPPHEAAQAWLDKHAGQIENAMHYAAMEYIAKHWEVK